MPKTGVMKISGYPTTRQISAKVVRTSRQGGAFTLIELLTSISVVALVASLAIPAIGSVRSKSKLIACINNQRQLILAWAQYCSDNADRMPSNIHLTRSNTWAAGILSVQNNWRDNTNRILLENVQNSLLAHQLPVAQVYRCPADPSQATIDGRRSPRVRSVAMNQAFGHETTAVWLPSQDFPQAIGMAYLTYRKSSEVDEPAKRWVIIDEDEKTLNDAAFAVEMKKGFLIARWIDVPAVYHRGVNPIAFADLHVESHKWQRRNRNRNYLSSAIDDPDFDWLAERTTSPANRNAPQ
jgi:type II secretory pathway pseudopilin PulG